MTDPREAIAMAMENWDAEAERWPKNKKGHPKLLCYPWEADRLVASGMVTEDDIVRIPRRIPTGGEK